MKRPLHNFDMRALYAALESERNSRSLSWDDLAAEINRPFVGTTSLPISVTTIRGMLNKRSVNGGVVLQILRWLGRTPESFLIGRRADLRAEEKLPEPGPSRILRFRTRAMYAALNTERINRGMTWKEIAAELPGFTPGMLTNLANGPLIGFPRVMFITQWLGRPTATFVRDHPR